MDDACMTGLLYLAVFIVLIASIVGRELVLNILAVTTYTVVIGGGLYFAIRDEIRKRS